MDRPVIVASDLSSHAAEALRYAARFRPAPIHLFHVHDVSHPTPYGISLDEAFRALNDGTTALHVEAALERAIMGLEGVTTVWRSHVRPADSIVEYADEVGAGLVVVGTHGRTGLRRLLLGSVAEAVLRTSPCDVLVVPLDASAPWSDRPTRRVLCAVDLLAGSEAVADRAAATARHLGADAPTLLYVDDESAPALLREVAAGPLSVWGSGEVRDALAEAHGPLETVSGTAAGAIAQSARTHDADLVVVGSHQRSGAARALGSVAVHVLRDVRRPVWVVRSPSTPPS